jgi:hypothetical protein
VRSVVCRVSCVSCVPCVSYVCVCVSCVCVMWGTGGCGEEKGHGCAQDGAEEAVVQLKGAVEGALGPQELTTECQHAARYRRL